MTRTSARLRTSTTKVLVSNDASSDDEDLENVPEHHPAKRRKASTPAGTTSDEKTDVARKPRRKLGALREMVFMPLDVMLEIFGHLQPLDILHIARTTKGLRSIVFSPSARGLWSAVWANTPGVPPCPPEIPDPRHASMLFENACQFCSKGSATIIWVESAKLCKTCRDTKLHLMVPGQYSDWAEMMWRQEIEHFFPLSDGKNPCHYLTYTTSSALTEEAKLNAGKELRGTFLATLKDHYKHMNEYAKLCEDWEHKRAVEISKLDDECRHVRKEEIRQRLKALGWEDGVIREASYTLFRLPVVRQTAKLTDRAFMKALPKMTTVLEGAKHRYHQQRRKDVIYPARNAVLIALYNEYAAANPETVLPPIIDLAFSRKFREITEKSPDELTVTAEHYAEAMATLPQLCCRWKERSITLLVGKLDPSIRIAVEEDPSGENSLKRAAALFSCDNCTHIIPGSMALGHNCRNRPTFSQKYAYPFIAGLPGGLNGQAGLNSPTQLCRFSASLLEYHEIGEDITTTEIIEREDRFICLSCRKEEDEDEPGMTWLEMLYHVNSEVKKGETEHLDVSMWDLEGDSAMA